MSNKTRQNYPLEATVIDLYSRQIIGWSMADNMKTKLVNYTLTMAIWKRKPKKGLIWHSDRGSQYASDSHRAILKDHGIIQSMSHKGNCWDNAVAESFFHTLKTELTNHYQFKNQQEAKNFYPLLFGPRKLPIRSTTPPLLCGVIDIGGVDFCSVV
jgi:putative transposase